MAINVKIRDETNKIDIYEHLTGEEILTYDQSRIIEQVTLTYSPLGKVIEKQKRLMAKFKNK